MFKKRQYYKIKLNFFHFFAVLGVLDGARGDFGVGVFGSIKKKKVIL